MADDPITGNDHPQRTYHPALRQQEIWPGPDGYPWAASGIRCWSREAILRRVDGNRLLCTWTTGGFSEPVPGNYTMASWSEDDGATWSPPETLFQHARRGLFTTELFVPRPGEIHAFLQTYGFGTWMTRLDSYRAISRDGGRTWEGPHSLPGGVQNVWVNAGIVHSGGRWILPVSWAEHMGDEWCPPEAGRTPAEPIVGGRVARQIELPWGADDSLRYRLGNDWAHRNHRYAVGVLLSDDGGETFRLRGYLCRESPRHFFEPKVVELSDGTIALLTRELRDGWLWESRSHDGGETWSPLQRTDIPNPSCRMRPLRAADGRIVLLHNPNPNAGAPEGQMIPMNRRTPLAIWISDDDMRTWSVKADLIADPNGSLNYPDGFIDEAAQEVRFAWEDTRSVYVARVPLEKTILATER